MELSPAPGAGISRVLLTPHLTAGSHTHQLPFPTTKPPAKQPCSGKAQATESLQLTFGVHLHLGGEFSAVDAAAFLQTLLYHDLAVKPGGTVAPVLTGAAPTVCLILGA